jgi:uncharacterized protein (UPF0335 family)
MTQKKKPSQVSADEELKKIVDRIEILEGQKQNISEEIGDIYKSAFRIGLDVKVLRKLIQIRKKDINQVREEDDLLELYKKTLGMS